MNDDGAHASRRVAVAVAVLHARAQIARDRIGIAADFSLCEKYRWNGHFLIVKFLRFNPARAHAGERVHAPSRRVATFEADLIAVKIFLHRTRAKALAMAESRFERANQ
jgi:hypothetical protein